MRCSRPRASSGWSRSSRACSVSCTSSGHGQLLCGDRELPVGVDGLQHAALDEVTQRFLEEERVSARAGGEQLGDLLRQVGAGGAAGEQLALLRGQRPQLQLDEPVREALPGDLAEVPRRRGRARCGRAARARSASRSASSSSSSTRASVESSAQCRSSKTTQSGCSLRERLQQRRDGLERLPLHGIAAQPAQALLVRVLRG